MANEPEIKHARSFAITKALSLITEQGTEVPCCLDPREGGVTCHGFQWSPLFRRRLLLLR